MTSSANKDRYENLVNKIFSQLTARGFLCRGKTARKIVNQNCGIIEFQESVSSINDAVKFTINVGIIYESLAEIGRQDIWSAQLLDAHIRYRIGYLMPVRIDKWWVLDSDENIPEIERNIADAISIYAVPCVESFAADVRTALALWVTGSSPGLTAIQRDRLLLAAKKSHLI